MCWYARALHVTSVLYLPCMFTPAWPEEKRVGVSIAWQKACIWGHTSTGPRTSPLSSIELRGAVSASAVHMTTWLTRPDAVLEYTQPCRSCRDKHNCNGIYHSGCAAGSVLQGTCWPVAAVIRLCASGHGLVAGRHGLAVRSWRRRMQGEQGDAAAINNVHKPIHKLRRIHMYTLCIAWPLERATCACECTGLGRHGSRLHGVQWHSTSAYAWEHDGCRLKGRTALALCGKAGHASLLAA